MSDEVRKANQRRASHLCGRCHNPVDIRDGAEIGGMPGIKYRYCNGCGWNQAITKRPRKEKLR